VIADKCETNIPVFKFFATGDEQFCGAVIG